MTKQQTHPVNQHNNLISNTISIYSHAMCFVKPSTFTRTMLNFALPKNFTSCQIHKNNAKLCTSIYTNKCINNYIYEYLNK